MGIVSENMWSHLSEQLSLVLQDVCSLLLPDLKLGMLALVQRVGNRDKALRWLIPCAHEMSATAPPSLVPHSGRKNAEW